MRQIAESWELAGQKFNVNCSFSTPRGRTSISCFAHSGLAEIGRSYLAGPPPIGGGRYSAAAAVHSAAFLGALYLSFDREKAGFGDAGFITGPGERATERLRAAVV